MIWLWFDLIVIWLCPNIWIGQSSAWNQLAEMRYLLCWFHQSSSRRNSLQWKVIYLSIASPCSLLMIDCSFNFSQFNSLNCHFCLIRKHERALKNLNPTLLMCPICNVSFSGDAPLQEHLQSLRHIKKMMVRDDMERLGLWDWDWDWDWD